MNLKVEKIENNVVKMEISVPVEKFKDAIVKSYKKNAAKFNIPGFRKGKAPMAMIERFYGEGVFYEDAAELIIDETYPNAIKEGEIHPVDYPKIEIVKVGKEEDFVYTAEVVVRPEVKLGEYKGIEGKNVQYPVKDEDIDKYIDSMREKNARIIEKAGDTVEKEDIAVIDFEGFVDGEAFEGGKGENYELTIGSGSFIPGFEDQLIGAKAGSSVDVNVSFPEDYHEENLKGKPALFKVTVKAIKVKELPQADDELAKDISEFDTLNEYKEDLRKKMQEDNDLRAKKEFEDEIINKAVENAQIDVPEVMVEKEIDYMLQDYDYKLRYQGITLEKYVELLGTTMEKLRDDFKEVAGKRVKTNLVLEAIAKNEGIKASDEELMVRVDEIIKQYPEDKREKLKDNILNSQKDIISEEIVNNKVVELLVNESIKVE